MNGLWAVTIKFEFKGRQSVKLSNSLSLMLSNALRLCAVIALSIAPKASFVAEFSNSHALAKQHAKIGLQVKKSFSVFKDAPGSFVSNSIK